MLALDHKRHHLRNAALERVPWPAWLAKLGLKHPCYEYVVFVSGLRFAGDRGPH